MIGHLGTRVSALLDGQLSSEESERLWRHVHGCGQCREQVEHEGWVKTQLAGFALQAPAPSAPSRLAGALVACAAAAESAGSDPSSMARARSHRPSAATTAALGVGTMGAAFVGILAMSVPAQAPVADRRGPTTSVGRVLGDGSTPAAQERRLATQRARERSADYQVPASAAVGVVAASIQTVQEGIGFGQISLLDGPWATIGR